MSLDVDYVFGYQAVMQLDRLLLNMKHGERKEITDDIMEFVKTMKVKYEKK